MKLFIATRTITGYITVGGLYAGIREERKPYVKDATVKFVSDKNRKAQCRASNFLEVPDLTSVDTPAARTMLRVVRAIDSGASISSTMASIARYFVKNFLMTTAAKLLDVNIKADDPGFDITWARVATGVISVNMFSTDSLVIAFKKFQDKYGSSKLDEAVQEPGDTYWRRLRGGKNAFTPNRIYRVDADGYTLDDKGVRRQPSVHMTDFWEPVLLVDEKIRQAELHTGGVVSPGATETTASTPTREFVIKTEPISADSISLFFNGEKVSPDHLFSSSTPEEGDPYSLAMARTKLFPDQKVEIKINYETEGELDQLSAAIKNILEQRKMNDAVEKARECVATAIALQRASGFSAESTLREFIKAMNDEMRTEEKRKKISLGKSYSDFSESLKSTSFSSISRELYGEDAAKRLNKFISENRDAIKLVMTTTPGWGERDPVCENRYKKAEWLAPVTLLAPRPEGLSACMYDFGGHRNYGSSPTGRIVNFDPVYQHLPTEVKLKPQEEKAMSLLQSNVVIETVQLINNKRVNHITDSELLGLITDQKEILKHLNDLNIESQAIKNRIAEVENTVKVLIKILDDRHVRTGESTQSPDA